MNGPNYALERILDGERSTLEHLDGMRQRHPGEHEIIHVTLDLTRWSTEHVDRLASAQQQRGGEHPRPPRPVSAADTHDDPSGNPGLMLLADLQLLFLLGSENSLAWEMLAQISQALHDRELLALAGDCHPQTLRQIRWANTTIKTRTPQILSSL
jgi:hypothetical protein